MKKKKTEEEAEEEEEERKDKNCINRAKQKNGLLI